MFVFTSPRYQQVEPTGNAPVPDGMWGTKGPETKRGEYVSPKEGIASIFSGMIGTFPCPSCHPLSGQVSFPELPPPLQTSSDHPTSAGSCLMH